MYPDSAHDAEDYSAKSHSWFPGNPTTCFFSSCILQLPSWISDLGAAIAYSQPIRGEDVAKEQA